MYGVEPAATDWGTLVTVFIGLLGLVWGLWKWLDTKFGKHQEALQQAFLKLNSDADDRADKQNSLLAGLRAEFHEYQGAQAKENARFDRDIAVFRQRLDSVPTQKEIEGIMDRRVGRLETKIDSFTLELARNGVRLTPRPYEDNGA